MPEPLQTPLHETPGISSESLSQNPNPEVIDLDVERQRIRVINGSIPIDAELSVGDPELPKRKEQAANPITVLKLAEDVAEFFERLRVA